MDSNPAHVKLQDLPWEKRIPWLKFASREFSIVAMSYFENNMFSLADLDDLDAAMDMKDSRLLFHEIVNDGYWQSLIDVPSHPCDAGTRTTLPICLYRA